jgi:hypothetical protein
MSVLKPIKENQTVQINVKIPVELRDSLNRIKEQLKEKDFTIDVGEAVVSGIRRLIKNAEKELKELALEHSKRSRTAENAAPTQPAKPAAKPTPATKGSTPK